jgi:hypothetical protein
MEESRQNNLASSSETRNNTIARRTGNIAQKKKFLEYSLKFRKKSAGFGCLTEIL